MDIISWTWIKSEQHPESVILNFLSEHEADDAVWNEEEGRQQRITISQEINSEESDQESTQTAQSVQTAAVGCSVSTENAQ